MSPWILTAGMQPEVVVKWWEQTTKDHFADLYKRENSIKIKKNVRKTPKQQYQEQFANFVVIEFKISCTGTKAIINSNADLLSPKPLRTNKNQQFPYKEMNYKILSTKW